MIKKIQLKDQDVRQVVVAISDALQSEPEEHTNELCLRIPEKLGKGYIKAYVFDHGIGVLEFDCLLKKTVVLELEKGIVNPLKILFNREESFLHYFSGDADKHEIRHLESTILSGTSKSNHIFKLPANQPICIFGIEINRKLFEDKISDFLANMDENLEGLFRDVNGINLFYYKGYFSLNIAKYIEEFTTCELEGFTRAVFLEGKAYEILTSHLEQYKDDQQAPEKRTILRQTTVSRIEEAAAIIEEELATIDNVLALAKRVGINQNTLQLGFKQLYNTSVNEYIRNFKIEKAKELIENSEMNITEITYQIGINSRSYFSKLFKEKYGLTPRQYLTKTRNADSAPGKSA